MTAGASPAAADKRMVGALAKAMERFVRTGDIEECLRRFPDQADQLRPYLKFWAEFLEMPLADSTRQDRAVPAHPSPLLRLANVVAASFLLALAAVGVAAAGGETFVHGLLTDLNLAEPFTHEVDPHLEGAVPGAPTEAAPGDLPGSEVEEADDAADEAEAEDPEDAEHKAGDEGAGGTDNGGHSGASQEGGQQGDN